MFWFWAVGLGSAVERILSCFRSVAVHKALLFVQRCEGLAVTRPLTAILLPFFLLLFHAGWAGGPKKNCAASSPRSLLWLSSLLLLCVVGNAPKHPCGPSKLYHHENRCERHASAKEAARAANLDLCSHEQARTRALPLSLLLLLRRRLSALLCSGR